MNRSKESGRKVKGQEVDWIDSSLGSCKMFILNHLFEGAGWTARKMLLHNRGLKSGNREGTDWRVPAHVTSLRRLKGSASVKVVRHKKCIFCCGTLWKGLSSDSPVPASPIWDGCSTFRFSLPVSEPWVPHPFDFAEGRLWRFLQAWVAMLPIPWDLLCSAA